jgi:hypothetical protein
MTRGSHGDLDCSATFLQSARDWGEISSEVNDQGMRAVREAKASLVGDLEALRERGLLVFVGRRRVSSPAVFTRLHRSPTPA